MTAYTSAASGNVDVATNWTPNGIPNFANGDTALINKMMTIPAGVTFDPTITITGTSASNRAGLHVRGRLHIRANATVNQWNEIIVYGGGIVDGAASFGLRYTQLSTGVNNIIRGDGAPGSWGRITRSDYLSGEPASIISTTTVTAQVGCLFEANYLIIDKMASVLAGGGAAGNHVRLRNVIWDGAGFCKIGGISNRADDFIIENCDYRHDNIAAISSAYFLEIVATRDSAGTVTGTKRFKNNTFKTNSETSTKYVRFYAADYFTDIGYVSDCVKLEFGSDNTAISFKNVCQRYVTSDNFAAFGAVGIGGQSFTESVTLKDASDYVVTGSFHGFELGKITTFEDNYIEGIFLQTGIDGSDWFSPPAAGTVSIKRNILVDENGGCFVNSWKRNTAANITIDHNTVISRYSEFNSGNPYGTLMRSETGFNFTGGTNTATSNILWVIDSSQSSDGVTAAFNFTGVGAPSDQVDFIDNNTYFNMTPTPPIGLFPGVVITGKVPGDAGFGANDNYIDPQFTNWPTANRNSPSLAFAASKGFSNTKQLWGAFLKLNGFNETTRRQEAANATAYGVEDFLAYARTCVTPSNPLLAASAHDGTSRGAVQFTPSVDPEGDRGITAIGLTAVGLTASSFTARWL